MIDINYLKSLLKLFDASTSTELRIEQDGTIIKLSKALEHHQPPAVQYAQMQMPAPQPQLPAFTQPTSSNISEQEAVASGTAENQKNYHEIRSPIVGTFYRSSSPEAPPFTEIGQTVSPGQPLCIIEAMKLMNEIECDTYGKIAKILVENAQPVEYNQLLFLVETEN